MYIEEIRRAVLATPRERLGEISAALWKSHAAGAIGDDDAQALAELIQAKKQQGGEFPPPSRRHVGSRPRSPASIQRRRRTSAAGLMPPQLAAGFTMSEVAALSVIASEVARTGRCELSVGAIAGRAGTCATIVKNAVREARRLGLLHVEARRVRYDRNLPNIITIVSAEWTTWLRIGDRHRSHGSGGIFAPTTGRQIHIYSETARHAGWTDWKSVGANRKSQANWPPPRPRA